MGLSLMLSRLWQIAEGIKWFLPGRRSVCQWTPALSDTLTQVLQPRNYRNDRKRPTFELAPCYTGITVFKHFYSVNAVNLSFHYNLMARLASLESFLKSTLSELKNDTTSKVSSVKIKALLYAYKTNRFPSKLVIWELKSSPSTKP